MIFELVNVIAELLSLAYPEAECKSSTNDNKHFASKNFKSILSVVNELFKGVQANDAKDLLNYLIMTGHDVLNESSVQNVVDNNNFMPDQTNDQFMRQSFMQDFNLKNNSPFSRHFYFVTKTTTCCSGSYEIKYKN